jgi:predicted DNA-binding protein with PD1-like motif
MELSLKNFPMQLPKEAQKQAAKITVRKCDETGEGQFVAYVDEGTETFDVSLNLSDKGMQWRHTGACGRRTQNSYAGAAMQWQALFIIVSLFYFSCQSAMIKTHPLRLKPGADLKKEIEAYVKSQGILAGWIATCSGSLTQYNIRFANQPDGTKAEGHFEIVSLSGTVSANGSHIHISIGDSTGKTIGGHLLEENIVYTTAEIVLQEDESFVFTREKDGTTEWEELQVKKR